MKSNWFKYIFIIFVVFIMIFAIVKINNDEKLKGNNETNISNEEQEKIREIKLGIAQYDTINPILSNNKNVQDITKLIYEPLINLTSDYKTEQCLAKEWAKHTNTSYIIKLREDVKWSNGEKFSAEDVRYTIDKLKEISSIYSYNVQYIIEVDVIDNYTIRINLDREIPFFEYNLTFPIISKKYYEGQDFVNTEKNNMPVGTGKYKITQNESSYIILEKNNNWWNIENKEISLEKITINLYSSIGELYNSFKTGNIDLISTSNEKLDEYIGTIGYTAKEIKGRQHDFIALNTAGNILSNIEVRKAISYSIDKSNIISSIYNNKYYTTSFPLDFGTWIYQSKDSSAGYNQEQAKRVLVDAGWKYKYKYWQKIENYKTKKILLNFIVKSTDQSKVLVAENIKTQLENQGISINLIKATDSQYNNYLQNKNYDMILCSSYLSASPDLTTYFGENNLANYTNEEVSNIMTEVKNNTDENNLIEKYKRLAEIYKTDIPYISLYTNRYIVAYNSSLVGEITPNWFNPFYNIEGWYK